MLPKAVVLLIAGWSLLAFVMTLLWRRQLRTGDAGIVDVGWALGVAGLAVMYAGAGDGWIGRRLAIAGLLGAWGLRLGMYLLERNAGRAEDGRYAELRRAWGDRAPRRFFWFFQAQALAALFFALPALIVSMNPAIGLRAVEEVAIALWIVAFFGEGLADRQLDAFRRDPANRGRTCDRGLWRYSRHPNYFFEWLLWVAVALFALGSPWGVVALACPAAMLVLLFRVTGIPAAEAQALRTRGADYLRYQQSTSRFVPWRPRETGSPR
jgi:steroid 5-alpha reductase family enzyme